MREGTQVPQVLTQYLPHLQNRLRMAVDGAVFGGHFNLGIGVLQMGAFVRNHAVAVAE